MVARRFGPVVGVAGRLAPPGDDAPDASRRPLRNDRMRMGSGYALSAGECMRGAGTRVVVLAVLVLRAREW